MSNLVTVTRHDRVAVVALNNPPVNALSHAVRIALSASLKELFAAADIEAIVIACEGRTFVAGADIREFGKPPLDPDLPELIEFLDSAPKMTIAAIHGTALGGGLELSLACHFRVASESAKLGLPEVTLGILPGAGGTQRLPRLIGVKPALDMIVSGTPISAAQAQRLGLIDGIIADPVKECGLAFAQHALSEGRPWRRVSELTARLDDANFFDSYEQGIAQRWRGFLAPFRCIEAVRGAVQLPFAEGLQLERDLFKQLIDSAESKAQRHVFFGEREVGKVPGVPDDTPTRPLKSVAIAGDGAIAGGLARCFADAKLSVLLVSDTQERLDRTLSELRAGYANAVSRGRITPAECELRLQRIKPTLSYDDVAGADLLLEAVSEDLEAKRTALARLGAVGKTGAILASSSAFIELEPLADATGRPSDVVGLFFAEPCDESRLLEVVRTRHTALDAFATVMKLGRSLGKVAVPVHGHVGRRLLAARFREALFLLEEGALPEQIDQVLTQFGFPNGPFTALDLAGIDGALVERRARVATLTARERACTILEDLSDLGRLGKASGAGFYRYDGARAESDPTLVALLERHSNRRGIARRSISNEEIEARCLYSVINEAARLLEAGLATRALDVDMIAVHGCGFPVYRGGPLFHADQVGLRHVLERVLEFRELLTGEEWAPAPLLERLVTESRNFYGGSR